MNNETESNRKYNYKELENIEEINKYQSAVDIKTGTMTKEWTRKVKT